MSMYVVCFDVTNIRNMTTYTHTHIHMLRKCCASSLCERQPKVYSSFYPKSRRHTIAEAVCGSSALLCGMYYTTVLSRSVQSIHTYSVCFVFNVDSISRFEIHGIRMCVRVHTAWGRTHTHIGIVCSRIPRNTTCRRRRWEHSSENYKNSLRFWIFGFSTSRASTHLHAAKYTKTHTCTAATSTENTTVCMFCACVCHRRHIGFKQ